MAKATGRATKIPYFLHGQSDHLLAFAGLYEIWPDPTLPDDHPNKWLWTSTIVTRPATDALGHIHDRCPVLVPPDLFQDWLDCTDGEPSTAQALLNAIPEPELVPASSAPPSATSATTDHNSSNPPLHRHRGHRSSRSDDLATPHFSGSLHDAVLPLDLMLRAVETIGLTWPSVMESDRFWTGEEERNAFPFS